MAEVELMSDNDEIDYGGLLTDPKEESKNQSSSQKDPTRKGQVLNMTNPYRLGSTIFCLIPDRVVTIIGEKRIPRLYRKVKFGIEGKIRNPDEKTFMGFAIPSAEDFYIAGVQLTQEQKDLLKDVRDSLQNFSQFTQFKMKDKYPSINERLPKLSINPQIILAYGKLLKYVKDGKGEVDTEQNGYVRILKFTKGKVNEKDFATVLTNSIKNKINAVGDSWMKDYFSRKLGERTKVLSCSTSQASSGFKTYTITVSFEDFKPYEITKEDLEIADNLNTKLYTVSHFDTEYFKKLKEAITHLQEHINSLSIKPEDSKAESQEADQESSQEVVEDAQ